MRKFCPARGFTLIEAMIVAVVIGVLALLAIVGYRRWIQSSRMSEAQNMVSSIRTAEEAFRAENGGYLTVSGGLGPGFDYPAPTPGSFKTAWGGVCSNCKHPWSFLNVQSVGSMYFGYSVVADDATGVTLPTDYDFSLLTKPWYIVEADGDLDQNGAPFTHLYGTSGTNQIAVLAEGN